MHNIKDTERLKCGTGRQVDTKFLEAMCIYCSHTKHTTKSYKTHNKSIQNIQQTHKNHKQRHTKYKTLPSLKV
jgi:hypothetical protein